MNNSFYHPVRIEHPKKFGHTVEEHPKVKLYLYIADIIKLFPSFCWASEKLDTIVKCAALIYSGLAIELIAVLNAGQKETMPNIERNVEIKFCLR